MKVFKELPPSLFHSLRLSLIPRSKLLSVRKEQLPVIVSLTSIPARFKRLHLVIRSLLTQSHHPKKIVLWINDEIKDKIPEKLLKLQGEIFQICYSPLNCSHRKLIHSLEKYPGEIIITCTSIFDISMNRPISFALGASYSVPVVIHIIRNFVLITIIKK